MHGLRCAANLLGWTRLLDEWIGGALDEGARGSAADELARAVARTRAFVFGGDVDAAAPTIASDGSLRFELRGEPYRAVCRRIAIEADVSASLERALASIELAGGDSEEQALAVIVADVAPGIAKDAAREDALACTTDALAWVLTGDPSRRRLLAARRRFA